MEVSVKFTVDPIKEAQKLSKGLRNKAIRVAMNKAPAKVKSAVQSNAPSRFGILKKSIRIKVRQYKTGNVWVAVVGARSEKKRKGKYKRGDKKGQPKIHNPARYGHLVERGTARAKAKPYLKPALQQTAKAYINTLTQTIREQVRQLLSGNKGK